MNMLLTIALIAAAISGGCDYADNPGAESPSAPSSQTLVDPLQLSSLKGLQPGDTVLVADGKYSDVKLTFSARGTAESPVVFRAQTPGGVHFTGESSAKIKGEGVVVEGFVWDGIINQSTDIISFDKAAAHCVLRNCKIDGTGSADGTVDGISNKWVSLKGLENEVSDCSFFDKRNMGTLLVVWLDGVTVPRHKILRNSFTRPFTIYDAGGKAANGQETIRVGDSRTSMTDAGCIVSDNYFERCDGELAEIISNKSCANLYEHNYFYRSAGSLTLRHGNNCTVRGNFFAADGVETSGGVRIIGEGHRVEGNVIIGSTGSAYNSAICIVRGESDAALNGYWTVKNATVTGNAIIAPKVGISVNYSGRSTQDSAPEGVVVSGNTIVVDAAKSVSVYEFGDLDDSNVRYEDNIIYGGRQRDVHTKLAQVSSRPDVQSYETEREAIKANAGVKWE